MTPEKRPNRLARREADRLSEWPLALTSIEICAGGGGQALGLEKAGFAHEVVVEIDPWAAETLRLNRPQWNVIGPSPGDRGPFDGGPGDVRAFDASAWRGKVDLLAGGVPCPPFSLAGKQLGADDERDMFPEALRLVRQCRPRAVMLENVRGLLGARFDGYRANLDAQLGALGYVSSWRLLQASDFGVPQLRPRTILVALRREIAAAFTWPEPVGGALTVGDALHDLMASRGWQGADAWRDVADRVAPTIVGGSKKHGGPDLGPTRAKREWASMGVDGMGIADDVPERDFKGMPKLTVRMAARLQGFDDEWQFAGRKTHAYRQVGNAFPPPVAAAVGAQIARVLMPMTAPAVIAA